jgi:type IV pilus assembly protein PilE
MSGRPRTAMRGFTLIELMVVVAVVAILAAIAMPSYSEYIKRSSREAAQSELVELAAIQEKIYLNSSAYTASVSSVYTGQAGGGLGAPSGRTRDNKYTLSATVNGASFTLTATPVSGSTQQADGNLSIDAQGTRLWGSRSW